jgi:hypothetical protein
VFFQIAAARDAVLLSTIGRWQRGRRPRKDFLSQLEIFVPVKSLAGSDVMKATQPDYFGAYHSLKLTRDAQGVLVARKGKSA